MTRISVPVVFRAACLAMALSGIVAASAAAQGTAPMGAYLFRTYCASCHGTSARGDGPLADSMRRRPADLTAIAQRNKGVFPTEQVFQIIDGRTPVKGHGGADMPVWGDVFSKSSESGGPEAVKRQIEGLVRYLEGLQTKTGN
jgi:mono/diheme cytochrome c family protein